MSRRDRLGVGALPVGAALGVAAAGVLTGATLWSLCGTVVAAPRLPRARRAQFDVLSEDPRTPLDQRIEVRFSRPVRPSALGPDTSWVRPDAGPVAIGEYLVGRLLFDRSRVSQVVIRPAAIEEYYRLVKNEPRTRAAQRTDRLIRRIERTGRFGKLLKLERSLAQIFRGDTESRIRYDVGYSAGRGGAEAFYPPALDAADELAPYRRRLVGDDALWAAHLAGDTTAHARLAADPEADRFHHPIVAETGQPTARSVMRARPYRRVLRDLRNRRVVTFLPRIPELPDASDAGMAPDTTFNVQVGGPKSLLARFTTRSLESRPFFDSDAGELARAALEVRVINVTPPHGETLVEPTTDWEDPDDVLTVPVASRAPFRIRLRFDVPLDPRTLTPGVIQLFKVSSATSSGAERFDLPIPVRVAGTRLSQSRLGKVEIEVTPGVQLDRDGGYRLLVRPQLRTLYGEPLDQPFVSEFTVAPGPLPADSLGIEFDSAADALPGGTAVWPAPPELDPAGLGLAVAGSDTGSAGSFVESRWFDLGHDSLRLTARFDDPATPEVDGTRVLVPEAGGAVEVFVRGAFDDLSVPAPAPGLFSVTPWYPLAEADSIRNRRFLQFRVEFTLPEAYVPGDPRPALDRLVIGLADR